VTGSVKASL